MLNITHKLAVLALSGAALATASNSGHASNVYKAASSQTTEVVTNAPRYWACPAGYPICPVDTPVVTASVEKQNSRTDATVFDMPERPTWSLEHWSRYYDYSPMIHGD